MTGWRPGVTPAATAHGEETAVGNWMGWNFGKGADKGQGRYEGEFVIVDVFVLGETAPGSGSFSANIITAIKGGKAHTRHIDAATLQELREKAQQAGANADAHAITREKHDRSHIGYEDPPGADWSMGGE